jgi:hypothetical protein
MGFAWQYMKKIEHYGLLRSGSRFLDIGSSNLYGADADSVEQFIKRYNPGASNARPTAERLSAGSTYVVGKGGSNEAFLGEVIDASGMDYLSFDIAKGYKTEILDFNSRTLPKQHLSAWDLTLNFGTTEHILNQSNSFEIIHDATKPGGTIFHQLPSIGYVDHCYFTYTPQFFLDMAELNQYEIIDIWFDGPGQVNDLLHSSKSYASYFPILRDYIKKSEKSELAGIEVPDVSINVILRKSKAASFVAPV